MRATELEQAPKRSNPRPLLTVRVLILVAALSVSACDADPAKVCTSAATLSAISAILVEQIPGGPWSADPASIEQIALVGEDTQTGRVDCRGQLVVYPPRAGGGDPLTHPIHFSRQNTESRGRYVYSVADNDLIELTQLVLIGRYLGAIS